MYPQGNLTRSTVERMDQFLTQWFRHDLDDMDKLEAEVVSLMQLIRSEQRVIKATNNGAKNQIC